VHRLGDILEPNNLRLLFDAYNWSADMAVALRSDAAFARALLGAFGPAARRAPPELDEPLFPVRGPLAPGALAGKRIAIVSSGGSGATAALCGVRRAFEDVGIEPVTISACSGSVLFASLWAAGLSADEMADFWLGTCDYVDPDWRRLLAAGLRGFRGFTGLLRGEAIERCYRERLAGRTMGTTRIPLSAVVWNIDLNRVEYLSTRQTPDLEVGRAARVAISIPIMVEAVRVGPHYYGDGGIVDIFPVQPVLDEDVDLVLGLNFYLGRDFAGDDIGGWHDRRFSILRATSSPPSSSSVPPDSRRPRAARAPASA
jgi:predicted acylesterase/phospholipase RssA